ncbi:6-methylsalicylic acid synthase [Lentzea fradiae]|uniref:6-methylsalicylic acid synthase n=1 Tax=Lentzea fradiae TaxID=200378 RepID=A0A1G8BJC1_9PSEU|nr:type I polyketide synthase [Lentzea fradiae]SDH33356.1 6-methylsalicylic acid synthase [Lentzea fradiae]
MNTPPVAVIGVGCRFAGGAGTPAAFWDMLVSGRDGIGDLPEGRWRAYDGSFPAELRRAAAVPGGFLGDVEGFDSAFFGLTPREAELMDPQQRLLLEVAWEALEHAGIAPRSLAGGDTGVFVGVGSDDYGRRMLEDLPTIEAWTGIGSAMCAAANRISYALDLHGPSLAVDTACSASLVATHLACQALAAAECGIALVGGVNLIIGPGLTLTLDAAGATAPDGRCKPFDADADGYGRGEGGGVLVLKLLEHALRDGDRVLSVIRGSAVRQDGRTNGIMAPSGDAQRTLLAEACARAGVEPSTVDYLEAHGTGTRLGDPLEAGAMSAVYGAGRDEPCLIGSVKPNIGHLEAGAGVASLIKASLALHHGEIPPSLNCRTPNPAVDWAGSGLRVATSRTPWPRGERVRRAGVSGFGYGGTIGHVVLEEAPAVTPVAAHGSGPRLFPLTAASEAALRASAELLAAQEVTDLDAAGHTLASRRSHLAHRAAVIASDSDGLTAGLRSLASGERSQETVTGTVPAHPGTGLVWVFSGHGAQWHGMGRELLDSEPAFAAAVAELEPVFAEEIGFSPAQVLRDGDFDTIDRIQTMIFVVQVGLAAVWRSYGVRPDAVIGHSVGEIAAAVACGALSPQDGARLSCRRSALLRRVAGQGAMAMTSLSFAEAAERLAGRTDVVPGISASPGSTVVSGSPEAVEALVGEWGAEGVQVRRVASDVAFHSPQMDALTADLAQAAADLTPRVPEIPMYSTASPDPRSAEPLDGAYWAGNLRNPVRLTSATRAAAEDGFRRFLEISAHPVVAHSITETLTEQDIEDAFVGITLRRDKPEAISVLTALGTAFCAGVDVDWTRLQPVHRLADLPPVAWQRTPHWHESSVSGAPAQHDPASHTLLGSAIEVAGQARTTLWRTTLDEANRPYPGSHTIHGTEIVPAAVLVNTFFGAAGTSALTDVDLRLPVVAGELQVVRDGTALRIAAKATDTWLTCTTATAGEPSQLPEKLPKLPSGAKPVPPGHVRAHLREVGVPDMAFEWTVEELLRTESVLRARVLASDGWPGVLDAALSIAPAAFPGPATLRMVAHIGSAEVRGEAPATADVQVTVMSDDTVEVLVADTTGTVRARLGGLRYGGMTSQATPADLVHEIAWLPLELTPSGTPRTIVRAGEDLGGATDVLVVAPDPSGDVPDAAAEAAWSLLSTAQRLSSMDNPPRLWCVTRGVRESATPQALAQSTLWGLGRVLAGEYEEFWGGIVDLPADGRTDRLAEVVEAAPGEDVIAIRDRIEVAKLRRTTRDVTHQPLTCRPDGTYLVTGGLGVLGLEVAQWLAERGARRLVLAGRRPFPARRDWDAHPDRRQVDALRKLEEAGVTVRTIALDVADLADAQRLADLDLPPIRGVVHAAGVLDNRLAANVDEDSLRTVLAPKVQGAWNLHTVFPPGSLDFLVLFSSCGQLLGLPGQATYGAANAFLDALASHRDDVTSFGWTSWRDQGMAANDAVDRQLSARGVTDISAAEAFRAWDFAAVRGPGHYPVLRTVSGEDVERPPLLSELTDVVEPTTAAETDDFDGLPHEQLKAHLVEVVGAQIAGEMRLPAADLDIRRSLVEQGLDSVMTIAVRRRLEKRFGRKLPSTLLWHQPSVSAIADHLADELV